MHVFMYACMYVCMYVCTYLSIYLSVYLSIYLSIYLPTHLSTYLSTFLSTTFFPTAPLPPPPPPPPPTTTTSTGIPKHGLSLLLSLPRGPEYLFFKSFKFSLYQVFTRCRGLIGSIKPCIHLYKQIWKKCIHSYRRQILLYYLLF